MFGKSVSILKTFSYFLLICAIVVQFWGLAYWAITFRLGFTDYREQIASFPYRTLALVTLVLICLYFTFITHGASFSPSYGPDRASDGFRLPFQQPTAQPHAWNMNYRRSASSRTDGSWRGRRSRA